MIMSRREEGKEEEFEGIVRRIMGITRNRKGVGREERRLKERHKENVVSRVSFYLSSVTFPDFKGLLPTPGGNIKREGFQRKSQL